MHISETSFENKIIDYLKSLGYHYLSQVEILKKREGYYKQVILWDELKKAICKINPKIREAEIKKVFHKIRQVHQASLEIANKEAHNYLVNGLKIENSTKKITETVRIVDFENINRNSFLITNQLIVSSDHPEYDRQRPDLVIYLNGLPVVIFELKSPEKSDIDVVKKAYDQIKNYQKFLKDLFVFNIFNVISDKHTNKCGSITADFSYYRLWKQLEAKSVYQNPNEVFLKLLFNRKTFLTLLKNYIFYTNERESRKIIAGYHQFYGVEKSKDAVLKGINSKKEEDKKAGIFWHTQGSGKSFSMIMLVRNVIVCQPKLTVVVITDRNSLDEQINIAFHQAQNYVGQGQKIEKINSIKDLKKKLLNRKQNGIFFSTVQKFSSGISLLSKRDDILIIVDEAHRSHKRDKERELKIIGERQVERKVLEKFSYAYNLRKAFPLATFIGFTATPIERKDFATKQVFGDYLTKYLINDAISDGFIVNIKFESRQKTLKLDPKYISFLDEEHESNIEKILKVTDSPEVIKKYNREVQKIEKIIGDKDRIKAVAKDFIEHYQARKNLLKGKAVFVAFNRKIALQYYHTICQLVPALKQHLKIIMTGSNQDNEEDAKLIGNKEDRKKWALEFKKPDSDFKIAIVVEMWLTGFDVPPLDVIYIDRYIKMHNLMQAICRVNRVYTESLPVSLVKKNGLVVDYIGLIPKIKEAYKFYSNYKEIEGYWNNTIKDKGRLLKLVIKIYQDFFIKLPTIDDQKIADNSGDYIYQTVEKMEELIYRNCNKNNFLKATREVFQLFNITLTILTKEQKHKAQLLILVRGQLIKREISAFDLQFTVREMHKLLEQAIQYNKTVIYDQHDNNPISLHQIVDYVNKGEKTDNPHLEISKKLYRLKDANNQFARTNPIRAEKLSVKINQLLVKYENNFLNKEDLVHFLKDIKEIYQEIVEKKESYHKLGMSRAEFSFYEIISNNQYSKNSYDDQMIQKITKEVFLAVRKNINQTWLYSPVMKQQVRATLKKMLVKHNYPPEQQRNLQKELVNNLSNHMEKEPEMFVGREK